MIKRILVVWVAIAALVLVPVPAPVSAQPQTLLYPGSGEMKHHDFNICSTNDCAFGGPEAAIDLIVYFRGTVGMTSLSVQEACRQDIQQISARTGMYGFMGVAWFGKPACPGFTDFGNGSFTVGTPILGSYDEYVFPTQYVSGCNRSVRECRVAVCVSQTTLLGVVTVCSAHLEVEKGNGVNPIAYYQAGQYRIWEESNPFYTTGGLVLSGDFNLIPSQIPSSYNTYYYKAPSAYTWPASNPSKQIDYVWHDKAHSDNNILIAPYCNSIDSDHCYVFSRFS